MLVTIALSAIAVFAPAALLINIVERKEARNPFHRVVDLNDTVSDPAVWGKNFPMQYDLYLRTKYGGSEAEPRSPTQADPTLGGGAIEAGEGSAAQTMWAGYAFSKDYRERRGHAYRLEDQTSPNASSLIRPEHA
jgi:nitrite reductase (cytochrome c-552)